MNDTNVRYFLETVRKGSLTKAAHSLSISQPALTMGLNNLEKKLGFKLLNRKSNPVSLTEEGKIYLKYINSVNALNANFEKEIASSVSDTNRKVTIGAPLIYAETLLAEFIGNNDLDVQYSIKVGSQSELEEMLEESEIDCYISTSDDIDSSLQKKTIRSEKIYLCIPKDSRIGKIDDYSLLSGQKFIFLESDQPLQKKIDEFLRRYDIKAISSVICDQVSTCLSLSLKGKGLCFASKEALRSKNIGNEFDLVELPDDLFKRDIYIVYDNTNFISDACKYVIEMI